MHVRYAVACMFSQQQAAYGSATNSGFSFYTPSTTRRGGVSTTPNMRYSFGKTERVTRSGDFTKIIRLGTCVADGTLVLFARPTSDDESVRIGITIPKKTGNAVLRNRWKRLIRESFRLQRAMLPTGYEFIVRPKRGASPNWTAIEKSIPRLAHKAAKRTRHPETR